MKPLKVGLAFARGGRIIAIGAAAMALLTLSKDTFTGTDETSLSGRALDVGGTWTQQTGTWTITTNTAVQGTSSNDYYILTTDAGESDVQVHVSIKTTTGSGNSFGGLVFRFTDTSNYWMLGLNQGGNSIRLRKFEAGTPTDLEIHSWVDQYEKEIAIEVTLNGSQIDVLVDGGYAFSVTSSFNQSATTHGIVEQRLVGYQANVFDYFQVVELPTYPWTRQGTVVSAGTGDDDNVYEPTVIYEGDAQILSGNVFKIWYTSGWASTKINYAESSDGLSWTKYGSNPVFDTGRRSHVLHDGSTYYMYAGTSDTQINLYTSSDGLTWALDTANVITLGSAGAWDDSGLANSFVWKESANDWRMIYEGRGTGSRSSNIWALGYATSTDGSSWTKDVNNPVIGKENGVGSPKGVAAGPSVIKLNGYYYLFATSGPPDTSQLPSYILRYRSTDLVNWEVYPAFSIAHRIGADEGEETYVGQAVDPSVLIVGNTAYMYFAAASDGTSQSGNQHIVLQTANSLAMDNY